MSDNLRTSLRRRRTGIGWLLLAGAPALAQTPIDEIQVTATRREVALADVSSAVTLIGEDRVARHTLVTDALGATAGVFVQETTPGQGSAIVRGLKGSQILHLVDGFRLNNAIFRDAPTQYPALIDPLTVSRVEVARGAVSSLYGSDAMGGVINMISRLPQPGAGGSADLRLRVDSADLERFTALSLEAAGESQALLLQSSWRDSGNRRTGAGTRIPFTAYRSRALRAVWLHATEDRRQTYVDFQYLGQPGTHRVDELLPGFGQATPGSAEFEFAPNERRFAHVHHAWSDRERNVDWVVDAGWQQIVDDRRIRGFGSDLRRFESNRSDLFGASVQASGAWKGLDWVAGIEHYADSVDSRRTELSLLDQGMSRVEPRFPDGASVDQSALFANLRHDLSSRATISGGLRYSRVDATIPAGATAPGADTRVDDISGEVGIAWHVHERFSLLANAGRGFRAPNVFDLGTFGERPGNRFNVPNANLDAEFVNQFDLGVRADLETLRLELFIYRLRYRDRIESVLTGDFTTDGRQITQSRNLASASIHGVEGGFELALGADTVLSGVVNSSRGESRAPGEVETAADRIAPLNGRLGLRHRSGERLTLEPYVVVAARQDRLSPRDVADTRIDPNGTAGWATLNFDVLLDVTPRLRLGVHADNILDRRYRVHGSGIDARGRNLVVTIDASW